MRYQSTTAFFLIITLTSPGLSNDALWMLDVETLTSQRERPLFSLNRRPISISEITRSATSSSQLSTFQLVGVIREISGPSTAILQTLTGDIVKVSLGATYQNWLLKEVTARRAVFETSAGLKELYLADPARDLGHRNEPSSGPATSSSEDGVPMYHAPLIKMP